MMLLILLNYIDSWLKLKENFIKKISMNLHNLKRDKQ